MNWSSNIVGQPFLSRPSQSSLATFLCNDSNHDPFSGLETSQMMVSPIILREGNNCKEDQYGCQEKKRKLTTEQLESLERSFQEEIKLEPDRKMKLARELGLEPRQIAVWFQNRRARWRAKKLEHLYELLKQEFEVVTREKLKLQQEVVRLKSKLEEEAKRKKQMSTCNTEGSCEETVESRNDGIQSSSSKALEEMWSYKQNQESQILLNVDDYSLISPSYWATIPSPNYP